MYVYIYIYIKFRLWYISSRHYTQKLFFQQDFFFLALICHTSNISAFLNTWIIRWEIICCSYGIQILSITVLERKQSMLIRNSVKSNKPCFIYFAQWTFIFHSSPRWLKWSANNSCYEKMTVYHLTSIWQMCVLAAAVRLQKKEQRKPTKLCPQTNKNISHYMQIRKRNPKHKGQKWGKMAVLQHVD